MKICARCRTRKLYSDFRRHKSRLDGCQSYCKACQRDERLERRAAIQLRKSGPCQDCGCHFPPECMDFDHRENKKFSIGSSLGSKGLSALILEIKKCDVVCANC